MIHTLPQFDGVCKGFFTGLHKENGRDFHQAALGNNWQKVYNLPVVGGEEDVYAVVLARSGKTAGLPEILRLPDKNSLDGMPPIHPGASFEASEKMSLKYMKEAF